MKLPRLRNEGERYGYRSFTKRPLGAMVRERRARRRQRRATRRAQARG